MTVALTFLYSCPMVLSLLKNSPDYCYYVEWPLKKAGAPLLSEDEELASSSEYRVSVVAPATPSVAAASKAAKKRKDDDLTVGNSPTISVSRQYLYTHWEVC